MYKEILHQFTIKCTICKKDMKRKHSNQKYCEECAPKRAVQLKRKWKRDHYIKQYSTRVCPICANIFNTRLPRKMYCSTECQIKQQRITRYEKQIMRLQLEIRRLRGENIGSM
jgi:hypothetical protein